MKRWVLWFLIWLALVVLLYRMPVPLTASQAYPVPTSPYPGPRAAYFPVLLQAGAMPTPTATVSPPEPTQTASPTLTGVVQPSPTPTAGRAAGGLDATP